MLPASNMISTALLSAELSTLRLTIAEGKQAIAKTMLMRARNTYLFAVHATQEIYFGRFSAEITNFRLHDPGLGGNDLGRSLQS